MAKLLSKDGYKVSIEFSISKEDFKKGIDAAYKKTKNRYSVPGFRKGKAPRKVIENNYGPGIFYEDAINELLPEAYENAILQLDLDIVSKPDIDIKEFNMDKDIIIEAKVDVIPEIEIPEYKDLECEVEYADYDEAVVDGIIDSEREKNSRLVPVEGRAAEDGDTVVIDFLGKVDGKEFEGGAGKNHNLILGSNSFIPGFEGQIVGKETGSEFDVNVSFPEDYHHVDLAGKPAVFTVTLHEIKAKEMPEFDDEFVEEISEFETVEEYRKDAIAKTKENWEQGLVATKKDAALKALGDICVVEVPDSMVESEIDESLRDLDYRFRMQGFKLEDYVKMTQMNMDNLREKMREGAEISAKDKIVLHSLINKLDLSISDDEVETELKQTCEKTGEDYEEIKKFYEEEGNKKAVVEHLKVQKALDELLASLKFSVAEPKADDQINAEKVIDAVMDEVEED